MADTTSRATLMPVSLALFGAGLVAIIAIFGLYAVGLSDLPTWLNVATLLCPAGLILGVLTSIARTRRDRG